MKKTTLAASAAILLAASTALYAVYPALAEPGRDPLGGGTETWADAKAKADMIWTRLDVNKDGVLNEADREARLAEMFDMIDANHDGAISKAEFREHHKTMMDGPGWQDKGRDGAPGSVPPPPPGAGMGMMMGPGAHMLRVMAEKADTNHDGTITRTEFDAAVKARFDAADGNHDGKLNPAERRAAWMAMRGEHGGGWGRGMRHGRGMGGMDDMPPPPPGV
ncbi:MAG: EF-hand domain-containing protein [Novosphingobium sp.]|nr:EF-hand domain-containing protein [Novosphingobium sp.]